MKIKPLMFGLGLIALGCSSKIEKIVYEITKDHSKYIIETYIDKREYRKEKVYWDKFGDGTLDSYQFMDFENGSSYLVNIFENEQEAKILGSYNDSVKKLIKITSISKDSKFGKELQDQFNKIRQKRSTKYVVRPAF